METAGNEETQGQSFQLQWKDLSLGCTDNYAEFISCVKSFKSNPKEEEAVWQLTDVQTLTFALVISLSTGLVSSLVLLIFN